MSQKNDAAVPAAQDEQLRNLLQRALVQLSKWQRKYGENDNRWLPPAGDVELAEDIDAALATPQASAKPAEVAALSDEQIGHWVSGAQRSVFGAVKQHRFVIERALASLAEAAPAGEPTESQTARFAIDGALAFGYRDTNPPPEGHWLAEYWNLGRKLATLEAKPDTPAPSVEAEPVAWRWFAYGQWGFAAVKPDFCEAEPLFAAPLPPLPEAEQK